MMAAHVFVKENLITIEVHDLYSKSVAWFEIDRPEDHDRMKVFFKRNSIHHVVDRTYQGLEGQALGIVLNALSWASEKFQASDRIIRRNILGDPVVA
jgi:hypothetical protein